MLTLHSRQSLKKYVRANHAINVSDAMFDSLFNKALKAGVEKGVFEQPKGKQSAARSVCRLLCSNGP
jgi:histone H1/5